MCRLFSSPEMAPKETYQTYLFEIQSSNLEYHFSLTHDDRFFIGPYWDHLELEITALVTFPEKIKGDKFRLTILGQRDLDKALDDPKDQRREILGIGELTVRSDRRDYLGSIPRSSLWEIERRIKEEQLKAINMHGHTLRYGRA